MEKLGFRVDDPELLDFIYSLGRERSKVICYLLRECMEEGGGYVPPRVMAATGFSYKNKKTIKKSGQASVSKPRKTIKPQKPLYKEEIRPTISEEEPKLKQEVKPEPVVSEPVPLTETKQPVEPEPVINEPVKAPEPNTSEPIPTAETEYTYVSSAPKINNAGFVMAGLNAFGGI